MNIAEDINLAIGRVKEEVADQPLRYMVLVLLGTAMRLLDPSRIGDAAEEANPGA